MFRKVLVANRGEIACRVIRTCRDLGVRTVAVCSDADRLALHVLLADEVVHIGPTPSAQSYLRGDVILEAARRTGAEAIHPGYGFLSENAAFSRACADAGVVFVGPPPEAIRAMGGKTEARLRMSDAGVPVVPGTDVLTDDNVVSEARRVGLPVMLKASAGGGGKGMQLVHDEAELVPALQAARRVARSAFADDTIYLEKAIIRPRHVEIQVLTDHHGHGIYAFERECSVQRRHQKIVEEAPASRLSPATREAMGSIAVRAALAIGYRNAGTFEFLVDEEERFYFLEMNTRLQVEHPVTEWISGLDLVAWQLRIAAGEPLALRQEDLSIRGHAVECRIYAEDPAHDYLPSPGTITSYRTPKGPGVRIDDGIYAGAAVPMEYDPLVAKLAVWGPDRPTAIARSLRALAEYHVEGIRTNIPLLEAVLRTEAFASGRYDTSLLAGGLPAGAVAAPDDDQRALIAAAAALEADARSERAPVAVVQESPWVMAGRRARLGGR
ncbi:MAG: acetyl-CoA carboxylase biotin carboxylase subunit [Myxococcales bacterium]